jgi:hypothetical protein
MLPPLEADFLQAAIDANDQLPISLADASSSAAVAVCCDGIRSGSCSIWCAARAVAAVCDPAVAALTIAPAALSASAAQGLEQLRGECWRSHRVVRLVLP